MHIAFCPGIVSEYRFRRLKKENEYDIKMGLSYSGSKHRDGSFGCSSVEC
jgi:hypothetical protein